MEAPTPTFCKDFASKRLKKHHNFSNACERVGRIKPKGKKSCMNLNKLDNNLKKEKKDIKKFKLVKPSNKRHHSQKFKLREYEIKEMEDNKSDNSKSITRKRNKSIKIINNIHDFIKKHRFKLRNDFDRKHSEQFLQSKETAFEMPILSSDEIVLEKNKNFEFTLKGDKNKDI